MLAALYAICVNILTQILAIMAVMLPAFRAIQSALTTIGNDITGMGGRLTWYYNNIQSWFTGLAHQISQVLSNVVDAIRGHLERIEGFQAALETMIPSQAALVTQQVLSEGMLLQIAVENQGAQISQMVNAQAGTIVGQLEAGRAETQAGFGSLSAGIGAGAMSLAAIIPALGSLTSAVSGAGTSSHQAGLACMASTADRLMQMLMSSAMPVALGLAYKLGAPFQGIANALGREAWQFFLKPLYEEAPITPEKAPTIGVTLFSNAMLAGIGAHMLSQTCEIWAPAKYMGVGYLSAFLADMGSFSRIAQATIGVATSVALGRPFAYNVQKATRPTLPESRDLENFRAKHEITAAKFHETMQYHGYSEGWIDIWEEYLWRDPRLFEIVRLSEIVRPPAEPDPDAARWLTNAGLPQGIGPDWWYWYKFAKAAYSDIDIPILVRAVKWLGMRREQTFYLTQLREGYRDGYLTEAQVREKLEHAGLAPDVIEFRMEGMDLEYDIDARKEMAAFLTDNYRKDVIGYDEYYSGLRKIGMVEAKATLKAERELTRKMPKGGA